MHQYLYCLYDLVSESVVGPPIVQKGDAPAIRVFHNVLQDENSIMGKHPADFNLVCVGAQNAETGAIMFALEKDANAGEVVYSGQRVVATGAAWVSQRMADSQAQTVLPFPGVSDAR